MEDLVNALANSQVPNGSLKKAMQPTNVDMTPYFADSELCWPKYSVQWVASSHSTARGEISQQLLVVPFTLKLRCSSVISVSAEELAARARRDTKPEILSTREIVIVTIRMARSTAKKRHGCSDFN